MYRYLILKKILFDSTTINITKIVKSLEVPILNDIDVYKNLIEKKYLIDMDQKTQMEK